jgi:hypothetical protein
MSKFSERVGITRPKTGIQVSSMDTELRDSLWNVLSEVYWEHGYLSVLSNPTYIIPEMYSFLKILWARFFKEPHDFLSEYNWREPYVRIRKRYFNWSWYEIYDFIEFCVNHYPNDDKNNSFLKASTLVLERELSGYRFVGKQICPVTTKEEILEIEQAMSSPLKPISLHFENAIRLMSDRASPDYRNSIKESISAVESICRIILGDESITLGKALDKIEHTGAVKMQKPLKDAFDHLYGFTSGSEGIRHALGLLEDQNLNLEEAKFMLVSCSAFVNYLVTKASKAGIALGFEEKGSTLK